jgi:hypothetical protein
LYKLQRLHNSYASDEDINKAISKEFDKIFFSTDAYSLFNGLADQPERKEKLYGKYKLVTKKISGGADYAENHNKQIDMIANIKNLNICTNIDFTKPEDIIKLRANFLNNIVRYTDRKLD